MVITISDNYLVDSIHRVELVKTFLQLQESYTVKKLHDEPFEGTGMLNAQRCIQ